MRESFRSQLRSVLLIWAAASLTWAVGYGAALAITIFGLYEAVTSFSSDDPSFVGVGLMAIGCGLQLVLALLFLGIRDRFERRCWQLIAADGGALADPGATRQVLAQQADGEANDVGDVRKAQSRRLSARLRVLIEQAWPDRSR